MPCNDEDALFGYMKFHLSTLFSSEVQALLLTLLSFNLFMGELG